VSPHRTESGFFFFFPDLEEFLRFPATSLSELPIYPPLLHGHFTLPEQRFTVLMQGASIVPAHQRAEYHSPS